MKVKNAKPQRYFGLHMAEGVAEYSEPGKEPYRIFLNEKTLKEMDPTFSGCPVFVRHKDEVKVEDFMNQDPDGIVVRSFFNKSDGRHWCEFMVFTDEGQDRIRQGWKLSNAYFPRQESSGGEWHGVAYDREIHRGEYEHLAIVPNPRYAESVVLTPEQFQQYNSQKESELAVLTNSNDDKGAPMFFKKQKVDNAKDLEGMHVTLPKSKAELPLSQVINEMDEYRLKMAEPQQMANMDHHLEYNGKKMTLNEFMEHHKAMNAELESLKKKHADDGMSTEGDENLDNEETAEEKAAREKKENDDKEAKEKADKDKKENEKRNAEALKNADRDAAAKLEAEKNSLPPVMTTKDRVELGRKSYGAYR